MSGFFVFSGELLRDARENNGFTREELAQRTGSSYPAIESYENGYRTPPRETVLRLADALGVQPRTLVVEDPMFSEVSA